MSIAAAAALLVERFAHRQPSNSHCLSEFTGECQLTTTLLSTPVLNLAHLSL